MNGKTLACPAFALLLPVLLTTGCGGESTDTKIVTEYQTNNVPVVAIDGTEQVVMESSFILDGSASHDTDGTIEHWSWSQLDTGAPVAIISDATTAIASITAPTTTVPVDLVFHLTVTDDKGASAEADFTIAIKPVFAFTPCSADDVSALSASGVYPTQKISDVIALCDGDILVGNASNSRIEHVDLGTGAVTAYYELSAAPADMEFDSLRGLVYASMKGATSVARLDLTSGLVDYIPVTGVPTGIAARHGNGVYIVSSSWPNSQVYWYDANDVEHGPHPASGNMIQLNQTLNQVITAARSSSPTTLYVYGFDNNGDMELVDSRSNVGGNSQTLKISPNDAHLVLVAGGGNAEGYGITDFYPSDLSSTFGEFTTGAYPTGGDFSSDSSRLATSNGSSFLVYQVSNHAELFRATPAISGCQYDDLDATYISRGGKIGIALQRCGYSKDTTNLHWYKLP